MRALRGCLGVTVLVVALSSLFGPLWWVYTASTLPNPIESALDVETFFRQSIESERQSQQYNKRIKDRESVKWERPDFTRLPKHMVALYITETGCPTYFQTKREEGLAWTRRVVMSTLGSQLDGDGACELIFAKRLARRMGAKTSAQVNVAADRIHRFLQRDELVAFDLHAMQFEPGVVGIEAGARLLMQKELTEMSLAELAEMQLAIPPADFWDEVKTCSDANLIRINRDRLLQNLAWAGLASEEMVKTAATAPARCTSVKRAP